MNLIIDQFLISDDRNLLQLENICALLKTTYWANERSRETIARSVEHSLSFGVYYEGEQIGFARCVTDYATTFWLADVIVDERFRGQGAGKALVSAILSHESLQGLSGILATRDAHTLYERNGFALVEPNKYMRRPAVKVEPAVSELD
jgi:GNAT superfamily N-acetyltransferase